MCEPAVCLCLLHPSPRSHPHKAPLLSFLLCQRLIRGKLVRDTRASVLTLTVGHWNANREHARPNGVAERQIFGQDLFFFHWWSRLVYGRWNKVRADGQSVCREFIWVVLRSNKKLVKKRKELKSVLQSSVTTSSTKNWQNGFLKTSYNCFPTLMLHLTHQTRTRSSAKINSSGMILIFKLLVTQSEWS